jgi:Family of unknown function (DUF6445)
MQHLSVGREGAPLLVIDNVLADPGALVDQAAGKLFGDVASYYPGIRSKVPLTLQHFILGELRGELARFFGLNAAALRFTSCHFSLVTTPPAQLTYLQRIPHIDSVNSNELAMVLYLFKANHGGTAFYRHRATGFEVVDQARQPEYWRQIQAEQPAIERSPPSYISGDTDFYEQIAHQDGVFNRLLAYRRTSLHSGALGPDFNASADPRKGRLSINAFLA